MLDHSIATFRQFFGSEAEYVVCTDNPGLVRGTLRTEATLLDVTQTPECEFADTACTWRKWWPRCRLSPGHIEFYVDSDMFLLARPDEIWAFCDDPAETDYVCTTEPFSHGYYGNFKSRINSALPFINAGFLGQHRHADLTNSLRAEYRWWQEHVGERRADYHDEQGAVRAALELPLKQGKVALLPSDRYTVACPLNDPPIERVDDLILLHTTFPDRPAFHRFYGEISKVSGLS